LPTEIATQSLVSWIEDVVFAAGGKVVGAGISNRSKLSVGYFTEYGSVDVDLLLPGILVKSQVREVAEYLGILKMIMDKPPSACLWWGKTDLVVGVGLCMRLYHYLMTAKLLKTLGIGFILC
jgi:NAD+ synthase